MVWGAIEIGVFGTSPLGSAQTASPVDGSNPIFRWGKGRRVVGECLVFLSQWVRADALLPSVKRRGPNDLGEAPAAKRLR